MSKPSICFEDILDNCITAIEEQGKTVAECLACYPDRREELEPLLLLAVRLQAARTLRAPSEFRRTSAIRVRNAIATQQHRVERTITRPNILDLAHQRLQVIFGRRRRFPMVITISFLLAVWLLVSGGVVYASTDALPGDALYSVKRGIESVQLAVSLSEINDAKLRLAFVDRRLDEAAALLEKDRSQNVDKVLADYAAQIEFVLSLLGEDSDLSPDEQIALADLLVAAQARHEARFVFLLDQVPESVRFAVKLALAASQDARDRALKVLTEKPTLPEVSTLTCAPTLSPTEISIPPLVPTKLPTEVTTLTIGRTQPSSLTPSSEPTGQATPSVQRTSPAGSTPVPVPTSQTETPTPPPAPTQIPIGTFTSTPVLTQTSTKTSTPTPVPTQTPTKTSTPTPVPTQTPTKTSTPPPVPTQTPTKTSTPTPVPTRTSTKIPTSTPVPTPPPTEPPTSTPVSTPSPTPIPWPTLPWWPTPTWWPTPWWPTPTGFP